MAHITAADIQVEINERPMSFFQVGVIGLCVMINMLDGFDVMVMPFAASSVSEEWQLTQVFLGLLLTSALVGMAIGSLVLAPFGDVWGRRKLMLFCLSLVTLGMLLSSQVSSSYQLMFFRFLTGLGIGGMLATLNTLVSEFSNNARRGLSISILQSAFPLGAIVGGIVSVYLISEYGWRSLFLFGGLASMVMMPLVYWKMPESLDFLLSQKSDGVLSDVNKLRRNMSLAAIDSYERLGQKERSGGLKVILNKPFWRSTYLIWISFFCLMFAFYYVVSWTSKLLVDAGLTTAQGISANIYVMIGGIVGSVVLGLLTKRYDVTRLTSFYLMLCVVSMSVFGLANLELVSLMICASVMGFFLIGAMIGLYTIAPSLYPATHRVTGMGWAIGIGRIGAIISPFFGGVLLNWGFHTSQIIVIFALPLLLAAIAIWRIKLARSLA